MVKARLKRKEPGALCLRLLGVMISYKLFHIIQIQFKPFPGHQRTMKDDGITAEVIDAEAGSGFAQLTAKLFPKLSAQPVFTTFLRRHTTTSKEIVLALPYHATPRLVLI